MLWSELRHIARANPRPSGQYGNADSTYAGGVHVEGPGIQEGANIGKSNKISKKVIKWSLSSKRRC